MMEEWQQGVLYMAALASHLWNSFLAPYFLLGTIHSCITLAPDTTQIGI